MNFYAMSLSDLKYELDVFRRFTNRFGASDKQQRYLKAMERAYLNRINKQWRVK